MNWGYAVKRMLCVRIGINDWHAESLGDHNTLNMLFEYQILLIIIVYWFHSFLLFQ